VEKSAQEKMTRNGLRLRSVTIILVAPYTLSARTGRTGGTGPRHARRGTGSDNGTAPMQSVVEYQRKQKKKRARPNLHAQPPQPLDRAIVRSGRTGVAARLVVLGRTRVLGHVIPQVMAALVAMALPWLKRRIPAQTPLCVAQKIALCASGRTGAIAAPLVGRTRR